MAKEKTVFKTAREVVAALRLRYQAGAYAMLEQVGDSTGFKCRRHCDVLVQSLWPSRGLDIYGIEIKVSRSDFLKELEIPEKAEAIAQYCDYWFVAVGNEDIVKDGELPASWGLLVPQSYGKLRCKKEATKLQPIPLDRPFVASVLRQVQNQLTNDAVMKAEFDRGRKVGAEEERRSTERDLEWKTADHERLRKRVEEFEAASGISIATAWDAGKLGDAVRMVLNGQHVRYKEQLQRLHADALRVARIIGDEIAKDSGVSNG